LQPLVIRQVRRTGEESLFNGLIERFHYLGYTQPKKSSSVALCATELLFGWLLRLPERVTLSVLAVPDRRA
jgi:hypothetical protein